LRRGYRGAVPTLAARDQQSPSHGVGSFVATHEDCGAGFEITRNGRGRLHLVCVACGERTEYGAEDTEQLRAHGVDPERAATGTRFQPRRENVERWLPAPAALPWWIPNAYIVAVIAVGLGLIALGVFRPGSDDPAFLGGGEGDGQQEQSPPPSGQTAPAPAPTPQPPVTAGAAPAPTPSNQPERPARAPDLDRVTVAGRFAVGVPEGWEGSMSGGAVVFEAPGSEAELRVFLQPGGVKPASLVDEARRFLREEHGNAKVSAAEPRRLGKFRGTELICTYPGGRVRATLLSAEGYSFLILSEVDKGAPASARTAAEAALRSFRPV
jgi:hypothetical protein